MTDKQHITIRITDLAPMPLQINRAEEEIYRIAEANVNELYARWRSRFADKTSKEVLAMVAFQFAKLYFAAKASNESVKTEVDKLEQELSRLLFAVDDNQQL